MDRESSSSTLSADDQALLRRHLAFYRALANGKRKAATPAQIHFVSVTLGRVPAETPHERAYMKFMRMQKLGRARNSSLARDPDVEGPTEGWFTREDWKKLRGRQRWDGQ